MILLEYNDTFIEFEDTLEFSLKNKSKKMTPKNVINGSLNR